MHSDCNCNKIKEYIILSLLSGQYKPGKKVPTIRQCAARWKINPNTVLKVYKYLQDRRVLISQKKNGTFLTENAEVIQNMKGELAIYYVETLCDILYGLGFSEKETLEMLTKETYL